MTSVRDIMKKHLPTYKVNDATQRSSMELSKIAKITKVTSNLIIYAQRNKKNNAYFEFYSSSTNTDITCGYAIHM